MSYKLADAVDAAGLDLYDTAILRVLALGVRQHGQAYRISVAAIAKAAKCADRTVQRRVPVLVAKGYITQASKQYHAHTFALTDPATWPANHCDTSVTGDSESLVSDSHRGVVTQSHPIPVFNSPGISDEIPAPLAGPTVGEGNPEPVTAKPKAKAKAPSFDAATLPLPESFTADDRAAWPDWCAERKARRKTLTEGCAKSQLQALDFMARRGQSPAGAMRQSIHNGWTGLFPPRGDFATPATPVAAQPRPIVPRPVLPLQGGLRGLQ